MKKVRLKLSPAKKGKMYHFPPQAVRYRTNGTPQRGGVLDPEQIKKDKIITGRTLYKTQAGQTRVRYYVCKNVNREIREIERSINAIKNA